MNGAELRQAGLVIADQAKPKARGRLGRITHAPRWATLFALVAALLGHGVAGAQPAKAPRVGFLIASTPAAITARLASFRDGLRELGYLEGKDIVIELHWADGKIERLADLAAELVRQKVDIIFSTGPQSTRAAKNATSTIPIVMGFDGDPVGNGFVASLARPGGNITGLSTLAPEISGKQLEILKETVAKLSHVAVFGTSTQPGSAQALKELELAAAALRVKTRFFDVANAKEIDGAFTAAARARVGAGLVLNSSVFNTQRSQLTELAIKHHLPVIYWATEFLDAGGLMTYSTSITDLYRRAATYVDKILKGTKPTDIPVEQPIKFEFIVNLKAAKQIGLTIPPNVLVRADRVIR